jgi:hypothetical protein
MCAWSVVRVSVIVVILIVLETVFESAPHLLCDLSLHCVHCALPR